MKKGCKYAFAVVALMLAAVFTLGAQNGARKATGAVKGTITEADGGAPVEYAVVILYPAEAYTTTDAKGNFRFENVDPGQHRINVQYVGMQSVDTTFNVVAGSVKTVDILMTVESFHLEKVVVTATQNKAGKSTSSNISRQAMDHMQTSSLKDVMALLPGAVIQNPDLTTANTLNIRSLTQSSMNSLGTAVIVDGAPVSNNANMQSLSTGINGSAASVGGASPITGVDVRTISTDNVESIEVIRGIPSAEYGDLTSGAVIVKSKAGVEPLTIRLKTNPQLYQASVSKGISLGDKLGNLNVSGDYAYSNSSATTSYAYYQRLTAKVLWSVRASDNFSTNTSLDVTYGKDTRNRNPDDASTKYASGASNIGLRFTNNGNWTIDKGWLKTINYSISGDYTNKSSFVEQQLSNASSIYSTNMTDGTTVTNIKGQHAYDSNGNEVTNFTGTAAEGSYATVMPYSYFSRYDIYGKEINAFAKITANLFKQFAQGVDNRMKIGADFKTDGNKGAGLVFAEGNPPMRNGSNSMSGYRSRPFYDVPFVSQIGAFAEDELTLDFSGRKLILNAGGRFDWVNGKTVITPRLNASFEAIPGVLTIRGGYGITAKAPTAIYLYPQNVYFDQVNFNGWDTTLPEAERLLICTTKIYDTSNPDLKIATNRKVEAGFDLKLWDKYRLSVTAYDELMENGYSFGHDETTFVHNDFARYVVDHTNAGSIPTVKQQVVWNYLFSYYKPLNTAYSRNQGIEYELDLGRFDAINTSVYINGAWMRSIGTNINKNYSLRDNGNSFEADVAVYPDRMYTNYDEQLVTTMRLTTNIPQIGFVITLTPQVIWYESWWTECAKYSDGTYMDEKYKWYVDHVDGKMKEATDEYINDPSHAYLLPQLSSEAIRFGKECYFPTLVFNLNLTKEIGDMLTASFFVNNLFNSHPLYESKLVAGSYTALNDNIYFGMEVKLTIK
jgi:hypothetical protein